MQDLTLPRPVNGADKPLSGQSVAATEPPVEKNSAGKIALVILAVIVLLITWFTLADKLAPYSANGFVSADTTLISPRASGQVEKVFVEDNQYVKAGNPLFALDPKPFDLAVRQARAKLALAEQNIRINRAVLTAAEASVFNADAALVRAQSDAERTEKLFERGTVTKIRVEATDANRVAAETAARVAQSNLESAHLSVGQDYNPLLDSAQAQLELAELNRSFANITAPTSGHVTNLRLTPGQFVPVGSVAMTFIASDELWITIDLRENQLTNVDTGNSVSLMFDGRPGELFDGYVESVAWGIDTGRTAANGLPQNKASTRWFEPARTIPVRIALSEAAWPKNVRVGSKVTAVIYAEGEAGLIPWIGNMLHRLQSYISYIY